MQCYHLFDLLQLSDTVIGYRATFIIKNTGIIPDYGG